MTPHDLFIYYVFDALVRGWVDVDTIIGDVLDIYEEEENGEDILYFDRYLYYNLLTVIRNTNFATNLYKAVPPRMLHRVYHETPDRVLAFDEDLLSCQIMKQNRKAFS